MASKDHLLEIRYNFAGFISGPIWKDPITEFIEINCVYFEVNQVNNQKIHIDLWHDYQNLIRGTMDIFLEMIGDRDTKNLTAALQLKEGSEIPVEDMRLIYASDNESDSQVLFSNIMVKRRVELDLETARVLEALQKIPEGENRDVETPISQEISDLRIAISNLDREDESNHLQSKDDVSMSSLVAGLGLQREASSLVVEELTKQNDKIQEKLENRPFSREVSQSAPSAPYLNNLFLKAEDPSSNIDTDSLANVSQDKIKEASNKERDFRKLRDNLHKKRMLQKQTHQNKQPHSEIEAPVEAEDFQRSVTPLPPINPKNDAVRKSIYSAIKREIQN